ncbi:MAG: VWA domain-containing protein [bacterium]|nr:VWA domain-containing protein [bacterium]
MANSSFGSYPSREAAARAISKNFLDKINFSIDQVGLVLFSDYAYLASALTNQKTTLKNIITNYVSDDGTEIDKALNTAYTYMPKDNLSENWIILLTDGQHFDTPSRTKNEKDASTVTIANQIKNTNIKLATIRVAEGDRALLRTIASPGYAFNASSPQELEQILSASYDNLTCDTPPPPPPPPPSMNSCGASGTTDCSIKQIGTYILNVFSATSKIYVGDIKWIKLTIRGRLDNITGNLVIQEKINENYFDLINPKSRIVIYKNSNNTTTHITNTNCSSGSCLSNITSKSMTITLPNLNESQEYYIYFPVKAIAAKKPVNVDNDASNTKYPQLTEPIKLDNVPIEIAPGQPFFQAIIGDIYSHTTALDSIKSLLPSEKFFTDNNLVIYGGGSADFGNGIVSEKKWKSSNYDIKAPVSYQSIYEDYKTNIQKKNVKNFNDIVTGIPGKPTNYPKYIEHSNGPNNDLIIGGSSWSNKQISGTNSVVFVPGNLYIENSGLKEFAIAKDGKSSVTFIVKGRIGIDPAVTKIEGIYITDGVIDTSCTIPSDNACSPSLDNSPSGAKLALEGFYYSTQASGGFKLDRKGTPGLEPGEYFIGRPDMYFSSLMSLGKLQFLWKEVTGQ